MSDSDFESNDDYDDESDYSEDIVDSEEDLEAKKLDKIESKMVGLGKEKKIRKRE